MNRLILMRHAKTEPWYEGVDDHGRALTERGKRDAARVAVALKGQGVSVDTALVSTARRARETWSEVEQVFRSAELVVEDNLYLAGVAGLESIVREQGGEGAVLVIGHNPGIHDFACGILRVAGSADHYAALRVSEKYPTGCAAIFDAEEDGDFSPAAFKLTDVIRAKDLRDGD